MDTVEVKVVTVESDTTSESLTLTGKCLMCGDCCRLFCKASDMLNENGVCKFLEADNTCGIQAGTANPTERELRWWKDNCDDFPGCMAMQDVSRLRAALDKYEWPTENCGYSLEVNDG